MNDLINEGMPGTLIVNGCHCANLFNITWHARRQPEPRIHVLGTYVPHRQLFERDTTIIDGSFTIEMSNLGNLIPLLENPIDDILIISMQNGMRFKIEQCVARYTDFDKRIARIHFISLDNLSEITENKSDNFEEIEDLVG